MGHDLKYGIVCILTHSFWAKLKNKRAVCIANHLECLLNFCTKIPLFVNTLASFFELNSMSLSESCEERYLR
jgi:hypothetical protein